MTRNTATWFTLSNAVSGITSAVLFRKGKSRLAVVTMILAGVLDVLDGWAARKTKSVGRRGSILDSLADLTSFGAAPVIAMLALGRSAFHRLASILYVGAIAFRLVRFSRGGGGPGWFHGMPSPATAIAVMGANAAAFRSKYLGWLPPLTALTFAGLAVSRLPYGKITHPSLGLLPRWLTVTIYGTHGIFLLVQPGLAAVSVMLTYAFLGPYLMRKYREQTADDEQELS